MRVVIIGAGPAGVSAAETLRQADANLEITMISREPFPPYSPPLLATHFLEENEAIFWKGKDFVEKNRIEYLSPKTVVGIDSYQKLIKFSDKSQLNYDRLIIATGSTLYAPLKFRRTGGNNKKARESNGFYNFKSLTAALKIKELIKIGKIKTAVIVGAGFIGTELAIVLRELGVDVTQVEMANQVMPRMLDKDSARIVQKLLEKKGIHIRLNAKAKEFFGKEMAEGVELESGEKLYGGILIAATGVKPNVDFLKSSDFNIHWGLIVDDYLETNFTDVYAAGDCTEVKDRITGERYVHAIYLNARQQGEIAARNALGEKVVYEGALNMNSLKHLGIPLVALGTVGKEEELVYRGSNGILKKLYITNGRLTGARLVGDIKNAGIYFSLMIKKVDVRPFKEYLLDANFNMAYLIQKSRLSVPY